MYNNYVFIFYVMSIDQVISRIKVKKTVRMDRIVFFH
jgi:hypothetical protein